MSSVFVSKQVTARGPSQGAKAELFQHRIALRQVARRCHPPMVARVQIDGRDAPVGWFPERHSLHRLDRRHLPEVVDTRHRRFRQRGRVRERDRRDVKIPVSRSNAAPDQLAPPAMPGISIVGFSRDGGVNSGP